MLAAAAPVPRGLHVGPAAPTIFLVGTALLVVAVVVVGVRTWRRSGDPALLLLVAGAAVASFYEPVVDVLGRVYFVEDGVPILYTMLDRGMPAFNPLAYAAYVGVTSYIALRAFERGIDRRAVFGLWAAYALVITAFETGPILADVYVYYGHQPLDLWGYPLWWAFVNPLTALGGAAVVTLVRRQGGLARGPGRLGIAAVAMIAPGISNGVAALPMWLVLGDTSAPALVTYLAAGVTLALSLGMVWVIATLVAERPQAARAVPSQSTTTPEPLVFAGLEPPS
jgi:hypothetical protein